MKIIKAGFLVSYDYEYLKVSLPIVYPHLEYIFLCLDSQRKTWSGKTFTIDDSFWHWLEELDTKKKITIYEDNFYLKDATVIDLDTRERRMLSERMGNADWYMQIDSDEYFVDFPKLLHKLQKYEPYESVSISCKVTPMYKKTKDGFIIVSEAADYLPFITNKPAYTYARHSSEIKQVFWEDMVLHQSWARNSDEIKSKLSNWGHKDDFNTDSYYNLWDAIDEHNYFYLKNFHPLDQVSWPKLELFEQTLITDLLESYKQMHCINAPDPKNELIPRNFFNKVWRFPSK